MNLRWIGVAAIAISVVCLGGLLLEANTHVNVPSELNALANVANRSLPRNVDAETRLENVRARGFELDYRYTLVNASRRDVIDILGFNASASSMMMANNCETIVDLAHKSVAISATFFGQDGEVVSTVIIRESDCV